MNIEDYIYSLENEISDLSKLKNKFDDLNISFTYFHGNHTKIYTSRNVTFNKFEIARYAGEYYCYIFNNDNNIRIYPPIPTFYIGTDHIHNGIHYLVLQDYSLSMTANNVPNNLLSEIDLEIINKFPDYKIIGNIDADRLNKLKLIK